jgi:RNA polymerase sporulation-specific sigma factor
MTDYPTRDHARLARRRLIEAAQQGDRHAQHELVRRYEPLIQSVVWKLRLPTGTEREDLAQEARLGLLSAISRWCPQRGPFPAFAERCVKNQALLALKAASTRKYKVLSLAVSLDSQQTRTADPSGDTPGVALLDTLPAPRDARSDPEARLLIREQLSAVIDAQRTLTPSEHAALALALNGHSYKRHAATLTSTPKAASQAAYRARRKLAAALARAA